MATKEPCHVDTALALVRAYLASPGVKKLHFAKAAGMRESMLRQVASPDWNPTIKTLRAFEMAVPAAFRLARRAG